MVQLARRQFLTGVTGAATLGVAGVALSGCSTSDTPGSNGSSGGGAGAGGGVQVPTFRIFEGVTPDLVGDNATGVSDAYFSYPEPAKSVSSPPITSGDPVTGMILISVQPPTPMAENAWWQNLNENLGGELQVTMVTDAEYGAKFATTVAGGDMPDIVYIPAWELPPRLPSVLEGRFENLTEHLSGDAVLDYPNLANLPTQTWAITMANQGIYGVPSQLLQGVPTYVRNDVLKGLGLEWTPTNAAEVAELALEITDPGAGRYAFGRRADFFDSNACAMFDAPNGWREEGGAFTFAYETEEFRAALDWAAQLFAAGAVHPDAFAGVNAPEMFRGGQIPILNWGPGSFQGLLTSNIDGLELGFWAPPKADGGGIGSVRIGNGTYGIVAVSKQDSPERLQEILRVIDFMSAPFGSEEYLLGQYGVEGTHFEWDENHNPVTNDLLAVEQPNSEFRCVGGRQTLYTAGYDETTQAMYEYEAEALPTGERDASFGLYSETEDNNPDLSSQMSDMRNEVIQGRKSLEEFDEAVAAWKSGGGDKIRAEYEEAFAALNG